MRSAAYRVLSLLVARVLGSAARAQQFDIGRPTMPPSTEAGASIGVATLAELRALTTRPGVVAVAGHGAANDGGGGLFNWRAGDAAPTDDGLVVAPTGSPTGRYRRIFSGPIHARWFGTRCDDSQDDWRSIQAAIDAASGGSREVVLPYTGRSCNVGATLAIGNGTNSALSTINGVHLIGAAGPGFYVGAAHGVTIKWVGPAGAGPVLSYNGSGDGFGHRNIVVDANGLAGIGIGYYSIRHSTFRNYAVKNFTDVGEDYDIRTGPRGAVLYGSRNIWQNFVVSSTVAGVNRGMRVRGKFGNTPPDDWHGNLWQNGIYQIPKRSSGHSTAGYLGFADHNKFDLVDFSVTGAGTGYSLELDARGNNGYPQNNTLSGGSIASLLVSETADLIGYNFMAPFATADGEAIPVHPKIVGYTDRFKSYGGSPNVIARTAGGAFTSFSNGEITIFTTTVPANTLRGDLSLDFAASGRFFNGTGAPVTLRLRLSYGGAIFYDSGAVAVASDPDIRAVAIKARLSAGSARAQQSDTVVLIGGANSYSATPSTPHSHLFAINGLAEDSTTALVFKATVQMGTSSANAAFVSGPGILEIK